MSEHLPSPSVTTTIDRPVNQDQPSFTQEVCDVIAEDIGNPPEQSLFREFSDLLEEQADQQATDQMYAALHANGDYDLRKLETGEAAQMAKKTLGCLGCLLSSECHLRVALDRKIAEGENERKLDLVRTSPAWLTAGRLARSGMDEKELMTQLSSNESAKEALADGSLDIDHFLSGVTNELEDVVSAKDIPEINELASIDPDAVLQPHHITTESGNNYVVIDASDATNFSGAKPTIGDYKILSGKLLGRMNANDAQGNPQVLTADRKMQKPIRRFEESHVDEIRMNGKSRMYVAIVPAPADRPDLTARLVILGAHGGDEATQQSFINNIVVKRDTKALADRR